MPVIIRGINGLGNLSKYESSLEILKGLNKRMSLTKCTSQKNRIKLYDDFAF